MTKPVSSARPATHATPASVAPARATPLGHVAAATLLVVMLWGVWQVTGAVRKGLDYPATLSDFREGRSTQTIEKQIDQKLPARESLIAFANALRYRLQHGAGEQVRLGHEDWLFLTDEIRYHADAQANQAQRVRLLADVQRALKAQDVLLLVALVPDKARIYAQHLASRELPHHAADRYTQALAALRAAGVAVVDLNKPLAQAAASGSAGAGGAASSTAQPPLAYYRTDTHWNMHGAQVAAQAIAAAAAQVPGLALTPSTPFKTAPTGPEAERPGDLIKLMGLMQVSNFWRPQPDHETPLATSEAPVNTASAAAPAAANSLLGDVAGPPVVLLGTSYSLRGNFHGHLQQALQAQVLNTAKDGGGFLQAATEYFKDEAFQTAKPRLIVWEVPERFLPEPLGKEAGWLASVGL